MSIDDIIRILHLFEKSRDKALSNGNYSEAIKDHEQGIRVLGKLLTTCDIEISKKLQDLRSTFTKELKILQDVNIELSNISGPINVKSNHTVLNDHENDPDVWPPPTPLAGGRGGQSPQSNRNPSSYANDRDNNIYNNRERDNNLPSWARDRAQARGNNAIVPSRNIPTPISRKAPLSTNNEAADRLRRERDGNTSVLSDRYIYLFIYF
jgi:hypothetical protein